LKGASIGLLWTLIFCIFGLALIGGLALLCFTKAFGTVFLGFQRVLFQKAPGEAAWGSLLPMYAGTLLILFIGLFPAYFLNILSQPVSLYLNKITIFAPTNEAFSIHTLNMISICAFGVIGLAALILLIRKRVTDMKSKTNGATWGCAYTGNTDKMQYTASSFVRSYRKLAEPLLSIDKKKKDIHGIFPSGGEHETHPYDKAEKWFVDYPIKVLTNLFNRFSFLQNGILQIYILYGVAFVTLILVTPLIYDKIIALIHFLNQL